MPPRVWTKDKIIATIRRLHRQGVDLSPTGIQKTHGALFSSARSRSHFSTWKAAMDAAGLDYESIKRVTQVWSKEVIIEQIRAAHAAGEDLLAPAFKEQHRRLYLAACSQRYFGSWRRAIIAAGLDHAQLRESHQWTQAKIIRTIRSLAQQGKLLRWMVIEKECPGLYRASRRKENFGSWKNALRAAGVCLPAKKRR